MATADSVRDKLAGLIDKANGTTGRQDATLTDAVDALVAGYGSGTGTPSVTVEQATPIISVSSSGLITASATQKAGRVAAGTKEATRQMNTAAEKTVTPGTSEQTAVVAGRYTTGEIKVAGDSNLIPGNIKSGVRIFGVDGTCRSDGGAEAGALEELHYWEKYVSGSDRVTETAVTDVILSDMSRLNSSNTFDTVKYADSISVVDGVLSLPASAVTITLTSDTRSQIVGKYIQTTCNGGFYRIPADATISYHTSTYSSYVQTDKAFRLAAETGGSRLGVVVAANSAAYPADGEQDGYRYVYMGTLAGTGGGDGSLPTLTNPGTATDLAEGKELIDGSGNIVTGTVKAYNTQVGWGDKVPSLSGSTVMLKTDTTTPYLFRKGFYLSSPLSNFGDATEADVVAGKTFTSAAGLLKTGTHKCAEGSGGLVMKTGSVTLDADAESLDIATGLTRVDALMVYNGNHDGASNTYLWVLSELFAGRAYLSKGTVSFSYYGESASGVSITGGIATCKQVSTSYPVIAGTYDWIAVGTA